MAEFKFMVSQKLTIWEDAYITVVEENYESAKDLLLNNLEDLDEVSSNIEYEMDYQTALPVKIEDNNYNSTIVVTDATSIIYKNGK